MRPCPHCAEPIPEGRLLCPHCGALALPPPSDTPGAWPPSPRSLRPPPSPDRLLTRRRWLDGTLGFALVFVSAVLGYIGFYGTTALLTFFLVLAGSPLLYFFLRDRYPVFCRGIGWGLLAVPGLVLLFLLGAFALCIYSAGSGGR